MRSPTNVAISPQHAAEEILRLAPVVGFLAAVLA
jgi:hypothetical protein